MDTKDKIPNIELRSEEVQELMGKIPPLILRVGLLIVLFFILFFISICSVLSCPESLSTEAVVVPNVGIREVVSPYNGKLVLTLKDVKTKVDKGDTIIGIEYNLNSKNVKDTFYVEASSEAVAYKTSLYPLNSHINKGECLYVIRIPNIKYNGICSIAYVSPQDIGKIKKGQMAEVLVESVIIKMHVNNKALVPMHNGMYQVELVQDEIDEELSPFILSERKCSAKIEVTDETIFERFFVKRFKQMFLKNK